MPRAEKGLTSESETQKVFGNDLKENQQRIITSKRRYILETNNIGYS